MKKLICGLFFLFTFLQVSSQKFNSSFTYAIQKPTNEIRNAPVLILMHGYGSNENDLMEMAKSFDNRFLILSLRAPIRLSENSYSWYKVDFLPDNDIRYKYEQVASIRDSVVDFIRKACHAYQADSSQVYVLGFSQGAIMAYDIGVSSPAVLKGIIALSGRMIEETKSTNTNWNSVKDLKIFIAHGTSDNVIKLSDSEKANAFLKSKQVKDLTYKSYDMPHAIKGVEITDITGWLKDRLVENKAAGQKK